MVVTKFIGYSNLPQKALLESVCAAILSFIFIYTYNYPFMSHILTGTGYMVCTYSIFRYTGAMLNPANGLAIMLAGSHRWKFGRTRITIVWVVLAYLFAITIGSVIGNFIAALFEGGPINPPSWDMSPSGFGIALFFQIFGSFVTTWLYCSLTFGDCTVTNLDSIVPFNSAFGVAIGGAYFLMGIIMHEKTGGVLNPLNGFIPNIIWAIWYGSGYHVGVAFFYFGSVIVGALIGGAFYWMMTSFWGPNMLGETEFCQGTDIHGQDRTSGVFRSKKQKDCQRV